VNRIEGEGMKVVFGSMKSKKTKRFKLPRYLDKDGFKTLAFWVKE